MNVHCLKSVVISKKTKKQKKNGYMITVKVAFIGVSSDILKTVKSTVSNTKVSSPNNPDKKKETDDGYLLKN